MELTCHCHGKEALCNDCGGKGKVFVDPEKLVETFADAFRSDDESYEDIGERLLGDYENATQQEKTIMNNLLVTLCGWSFETLVEQSKEGDL
jgi:hypothetical protein